MIKIERVAHVVIKVRSLEKSLDFYTRILGLKIMGKIEPSVVFLSTGRDHHELGIAELGTEAPDGTFYQVGMEHFAFKLRNEDDLIEAYETLLRENVEIAYTVNHGVTKSVYFLDPDGNELEVYADNSPEEVASFENPYGGMEKLAFATDQPSLMDSIIKAQQSMAPAGAPE
ncbi:glyoxalase/bleomycin resistance protein/dioxygenase superfamily protein [Nocardia nova SH22a]|uniref:Glyoxalase/bleomycin resistance protein/dioxygenase superfamily protein n=1 Tax=Nocardia nova SH22a TaxID=1415166 RepID=W5TJ40_9NOCA|nr:VOC family protein [Nocardia nova]AHH19189.1 glyoxalase/bleomycin resistance protein/dioxygenase superfamily protein [Nocardia nova SH22a]